LDSPLGFAHARSGHDHAGAAVGRIGSTARVLISRFLGSSAISPFGECRNYSASCGVQSDETGGRRLGFPCAQVNAFAFDPEADEQRNSHRGASRDDRQNRRIIAAMVLSVTD